MQKREVEEESRVIRTWNEKERRILFFLLNVKMSLIERVKSVRRIYYSSAFQTDTWNYGCFLFNSNLFHTANA